MALRPSSAFGTIQAPLRGDNEIMRRVVFNQKGGVGKSTITCNLAAISAYQGRRTLVVDLDPQGNTTQLPHRAFPSSLANWTRLPGARCTSKRHYRLVLNWLPREIRPINFSALA